MFSSFARMRQRKQIEAFAVTTPVCLVVPTLVDCPASGCGYDPFNDAAYNSTCLICNGRGQIRQDRSTFVPCRISWIDQQRVGMYQGVPTGQEADLQIQTALIHKEAFEEVQTTRGAYVFLDEQRLTPKSIIINRIEGETTLDIRCVRVNPETTGG